MGTSSGDCDSTLSNSTPPRPQFRDLLACEDLRGNVGRKTRFALTPLTDRRVVAQVALPPHSGELYRAASRLGEAHININYAYCGTSPVLNMSLVVFGVTDVAKAVALLEAVAEAA